MPKVTRNGAQYEDEPRDPECRWVILFESAMHYPDKGDGSLQKIVRLGRAEPKDSRGYFLEIEENDHETGRWGMTRIWNTTIESDDEGRRAAVFWIGSTITRMFDFAPLPEKQAVEVALPPEVGRQILRAIQSARANDDEEAPSGKLAC